MGSDLVLSVDLRLSDGQRKSNDNTLSKHVAEQRTAGRNLGRKYAWDVMEISNTKIAEIWKQKRPWI